ncbi:MAG: hypothetical protein ACKO7R_16085 [Pseudanabaena sp.]
MWRCKATIHYFFKEIQFRDRQNPRDVVFGTGLLKRDKSLKVFLGKPFETLLLNRHKSLVDESCSYSSLI